MHPLINLVNNSPVSLSLLTKNYLSTRCDCIIIGVYEDLSIIGNAFSNALEQKKAPLLSFLNRNSGFKAKVGTSLLWQKPSFLFTQRLLIVGLGAEKELSQADFIKVQQTISATIHENRWDNSINATTVIPVKHLNELWKLRTCAIEHTKAFYNYLCPLKETKAPQIRNIQLVLPKNPQKLHLYNEVLKTGVAIGNGINVAKQLGNTPANLCTPTVLKDFALSLEKKSKHLKVHIHDKNALGKLDMNAFLSVSEGSSQPPFLIEIHYTPEKDCGLNPVVLVGKGVTFDTGGISLKPSAGMDEMKFDMSGAGSVFGAMNAFESMEINRKVIALIPATENMPAHNATKPGDVVKSASGQTIEILNTDAEGRLILCDTLSYAHRFSPESIIDVATLTGACVVALGAHYSGLMSNDESLASSLYDAGQLSHDRCWQLPLDQDYDDQLKSNFADIANISSGRGAGTITAGCFLQRFINDVPWAHLDVAGTAWLTGDKKGSTGRPVALLCEYVIASSKFLPPSSTKSTSVDSEKNRLPTRGVIGPIIEDGLLKGLSSQAIIANVLEKAPAARTKSTTIAFYAHRLRKNNVQLPPRPRKHI